MRGWAALLLLILFVPSAAAEFGRYDAMGYPIAVDGTHAFPGGVLPTGAIPEGPLNNVGPFTVYPYYPVLSAEMQRLAMDHPDLVQLHSIGKSTLGLDMWMLEIANFHDPEMIPLEEREVVWVDGGTHSNEYSGVWFAAHLASFLTDQYESNETAKWIVDHRHTFIMPLVNPDGSHAFGRLNAHAVNVNRNYPVDWGALAEDPILNNPGPAPASEVETQANIEWFNKTTPDLYVSVHCCGNLWLYPYGVEGLDPLDQQMFSRVCDEAFASVREYCGPIWSTIYPASGSSVDTVYEYTGAVGFGYEMSGRGALALWGQPFTSSTVQEEETESWTGLMHGFLNVEKYGAHPALEGASVVDGKLTLSLRNLGYGNFTNGTITYVPRDADPEDNLAIDYMPVVQELPVILPGELAQVTLDAEMTAGAFDVRLDYAKRHMASPMGARAFALDLREGPDGLEVYLGDEAISPLAVEDGAATVPFVGPALLAVVIALIASRGDKRS